MWTHLRTLQRDAHQESGIRGMTKLCPREEPVLTRDLGTAVNPAEAPRRPHTTLGPHHRNKALPGPYQPASPDTGHQDALTVHQRRRLGGESWGFPGGKATAPAGRSQEKTDPSQPTNGNRRKHSDNPERLISADCMTQLPKLKYGFFKTIANESKISGNVLNMYFSSLLI